MAPSKVQDFFISFDSFGEPVALNYKGNSSHQTAIGALLSIAIKIFMLIICTMQVLQLYNYDDPTITQVSKNDRARSNLFCFIISTK